MVMMRWLAIPFMVLALAACESNKERKQDAMNYCKGFSFRPGTNGMDSCMQKYANEREQQFEDDSEAQMDSDDMALMGAPCC